MAKEIRTKVPATKQTITCSLAPGGIGLAAGAARQSTMIANSSNYPSATVYLRIKSGASAPTAGTVYEVYLLRGDDASSSGYRTDNAGASDAAITIENAQLLGTIVVTNTANKNFYGEFHTGFLGPLGPEWGIAIKNATNQAVSTTEGDHLKEYNYFVPEVQ